MHSHLYSYIKIQTVLNSFKVLLLILAWFMQNSMLVLSDFPGKFSSGEAVVYSVPYYLICKKSVELGGL